MTTQLSRERLDYLKERLPTRIKSLEIHEKDGSIGSAQQETLDAYRLALAVMDSEPVSVADDGFGDVTFKNCLKCQREGRITHYAMLNCCPNCGSREWDIAKPLLATSALVAVPDEIIVLLNHLEDVLPYEAFNKIDVKIWNSVSMLSRPDVFRSAMLKGAKS